MNNTLNWLITLSNEVYLIKVALQVTPEMLSGDVKEFPLELENKAKIAELLPLHVRSFGNIVEVEEIFEVIIR